MSIFTVMSISMGMMVMSPPSMVFSLAVSIGRTFGRMSMRMVASMDGIGGLASN